MNSHDPSVADPMIGAKIDRFIIRRKLAEGGMGAVYLAEHERLPDVKRVLKLLLPEYARNAMLLQRFEREATAASKLKHRNVISIDDVGSLPGGQPWIMMPFLDGQALDHYMRQAGKLTMFRALHISLQVMSALAYLHKMGYVHRDLKPSNIFITKRDENPYYVMLIDLGIAKNLAETEEHTQTGLSMGTPGFMAVEQYGRAGDATPLADVYAMAIVIWRMVTGEMPWGENDERVLYFKQMTELPLKPPPNTLSPEWEAILRKAMAVKPEDRWQSMRELAVALAHATPAESRHVPSGAEMLTSLAKDLIDKASPTIETVRNPSDQDLSPRLWPHRETDVPAISAGEAHPVHALPSKPATRLDELEDLRETVRSNHGRGTPVLSRYQWGAKLGAGGMAEVFAGTMVGAEGFARPIALKRVLPGYSEQPAFAAMFIEEARIASRLSHPNIVGVIDFDRAEGRLFLVMELVEGMDLAALIASGALPIDVAIFIASEMLRGLGFAHELRDPASGLNGVIHRDVSPRNVLLSWVGQPKIADFGLARARDAGGLVATAQVRGSAHYMSPEQANNEPLDPRSDLFSVGAVLYEMITGRPLFQGSTSAVFAQIFFGEILPPSAVRAGVPPEVDAAVMKLLARDREQRFPSAEHAIDALARCPEAPTNGRSDLARLLAGRFPQAARAHSNAGVPEPRGVAQFTAIQPFSSIAQTPTPQAAARRRWPWLILLALATTAVVVAVVVATRGKQDRVVGVPHDAAPPPPQLATVLRDTGLQLDAAAIPQVVAPVDAVQQADAAVQIDAAEIRVVLDAMVIDTARDAGVDAGTRPPPDAHVSVTAPVAMGKLTVTIDPWAQVYVDGRFLGQTPFAQRLTAGPHRLVLVNTGRNKRETLDVTISTSKPVNIEETW